MTTVAGLETALMSHGTFFQQQKKFKSLTAKFLYFFRALFGFCIFKSLPVALRG